MNHLQIIGYMCIPKGIYIDLVDTFFFFTRRSLKSYQTSSRKHIMKARVTNLLFLVPHRLLFQGPPENLKEHYFRCSILIFEGYRHLRVRVDRHDWKHKFHTKTWIPHKNIIPNKSSDIIIYLPTIPFQGECVYCLPGHHKWRDLSLVAPIGKVSDDWAWLLKNCLVHIGFNTFVQTWTLWELHRRMRCRAPTNKKVPKQKQKGQWQKSDKKEAVVLPMSLWGGCFTWDGSGSVCQSQKFAEHVPETLPEEVFFIEWKIWMWTAGRFPTAHVKGFRSIWGALLGRSSQLVVSNCG